MCGLSHPTAGPWAPGLSVLSYPLCVFFPKGVLQECPHFAGPPPTPLSPRSPTLLSLLVSLCLKSALLCKRSSIPPGPGAMCWRTDPVECLSYIPESRKVKSCSQQTRGVHSGTKHLSESKPSLPRSSCFILDPNFRKVLWNTKFTLPSPLLEPDTALGASPAGKSLTGGQNTDGCSLTSVP